VALASLAAESLAGVSSSFFSAGADSWGLVSVLTTSSFLGY
jgi:hypothetical protein